MGAEKRPKKALLYVVQHFANRGSSVLLSDFSWPIFLVWAVTKPVELFC